MSDRSRSLIPTLLVACATLIAAPVGATEMSASGEPDKASEKAADKKEQPRTSPEAKQPERPRATGDAEGKPSSPEAEAKPSFNTLEDLYAQRDEDACGVTPGTLLHDPFTAARPAPRR